MPKRFAPLPSVDEIRRHFEFDRKNGWLLWRDTGNSMNHACVGTVAGSVSEQGYLRVKFKGRSYLVARLIFKLEHGRDPIGEVDHRDLDRLNNVPSNLRDATPSQNCMNKRNKARTFDLPKGVCLHKRTQRYRARIQVRGRRIELGDFRTVEDAAAAYAKASQRYHGLFGRAE